MTISHPFPNGTHVEFDIEDLVVGTAIVAGAEYEEGWLYRLTSAEITRGEGNTLRQLATECDGGVWVCEHEVHPWCPQGRDAGGAA